MLTGEGTCTKNVQTAKNTKKQFTCARTTITSSSEDFTSHALEMKVRTQPTHVQELSVYRVKKALHIQTKDSAYPRVPRDNEGGSGDSKSIFPSDM